MTWGDCDNAAKTDLIILGDDGDMRTVMIVGEPFTSKPGGHWKDTIRYMFPVFVGGNIGLMSLSSRAYHKISAQRSKLSSHWLTITRKGAKGDTETTYGVEVTKATKEEIAEVVAVALEYAKDHKGDEEAIPVNLAKAAKK